MAKRYKGKSSNISHFSGSALTVSADFTQESDDTISKKALVLVEGDHTDSKKKRHVFDPDRLFEIVDNTNAFLLKGGRIPWLKDHDKKQDSSIGDLEGLLEVKEITLEDLPNKSAKHLIGKLGVFTERLVARGEQAVRDIKSGLIKTLSPGVDVVDNLIREISATPTPAIVGLSTFSRHNNEAKFALTLEEAMDEAADLDEMKEEIYTIVDKFLIVLDCINNSTEDELDQQDPNELRMQAVSDLAEMIAEITGVILDPADLEANEQAAYSSYLDPDQMGEFITLSDIEYSLNY